MASGCSSSRSAAGLRSFDFGSDDVLCSYEDYTPLLDQTANVKRTDLSAKDLHGNKVGRPLATCYAQPEEFPREQVTSAVEKCMKKYADNLMRQLEGISGRLTQLELYCFKLEHSIGEFRSDMIRDQSETDSTLRSLEKHVHEVHRSVQIIRDKQELSETQKELTKFKLSQIEFDNTNHFQNPNKCTSTEASEPKPQNNVVDPSNQQLVLVLSHQIPSSSSLPIRAPDQAHAPISLSLTPQDRYIPNNAQLALVVPHQISSSPSPPIRAPDQTNAPALSTAMQDHYILNQPNSFYPPQNQHPQPELHYPQLKPPVHDLSIQSPLLHHPNLAAATHPIQQPPLSQYQQPWPHAQPPSSQSTNPYAPYIPNQSSILPLSKGSGYVASNGHVSNPVYVIDVSRSPHQQNFQPETYTTQIL